MSRSFFEPLEKRQLMSATLKNGVLTVDGNDLANVIAISQDKTNVRVNEDGKVTAFRATRVKRIVVNGHGGNDQLLGRTNLKKPMTLRGGAGNDILVGGAMGDVLEGGQGTDVADYSHRNQDLQISLDDVANDGAVDDAGKVVEKDNVRSDVERLRTGNGNDLLRGSDVKNVIDAGNGLDTVYGMGGNDTLIVAGRTLYEPDTVYGGEGDDIIETGGARAARLTAYGEGGNDRINGSNANDTLDGGPGADSIFGQGGADLISGGGGKDSLLGGIGSDTIKGGRGDDLLDGGDDDDEIWGDTTPLASAILKGGILSGKILGGITIKPEPDNDWITGGAGNDQLHGGDDNDSVYGSFGNDKLWGDAGNDQLDGEIGDDSVYGGDGNDSMMGGVGNDLLVSIGGGTLDTLRGGAGSDQFWADAEDSEQVADADLGEALFGGVKRVGRFMNNISRNLYGQNLPDPDPTYWQKILGTWMPVRATTTNFKDRPFVSAAGVSESDVQQGQTGDCWFLVALAGAAKFAKIRLTTSMVDLGDGTYAFKFIGGDGTHNFVRVDADLPVQSSGSTAPLYAGFGKSFTSWAALMEKAFCVFKGASYAGLAAGGLGGVKGAFAALGMRDAGNQLVAGNGTATLNNIHAAMREGKVVTLQTPDRNLGAGAPVVDDHVYLVESVNTIKVPLPGPVGTIRFIDVVISVTLRNPWGNDGPGPNATDGNNDGLVTVSAADVGKYFNYAQAVWG